MSTTEQHDRAGFLPSYNVDRVSSAGLVALSLSALLTS